MKFLLKKYFLLSLLIVTFIIPLTAQESHPISITNPKELYSTYDFSTADKENVIAAVGVEKYEDINRACHENQWPSGIANLDSRNENRDQLLQYHITMVTTLDDKSIVEVKPDENKHMPEFMQSVTSFYFVIGSEGLGSGIVNPGDSLTEEGDFSDFDDELPQALIIDPGQLLPVYTFTEEEI